MIPLKKKINITETEFCYIFDEILSDIEKDKKDIKPRCFYSFILTRYSHSLLRKSKIFSPEECDSLIYYSLKQGKSLTALYVFRDESHYDYAADIEFVLLHFPVFNYNQQQYQNALKISFSFNIKRNGKIIYEDLLVTIKESHPWDKYECALRPTRCTNTSPVMKRFFKRRQKKLDMYFKYVEKKIRERNRDEEDEEW